MYNYKELTERFKRYKADCNVSCDSCKYNTHKAVYMKKPVSCLSCRPIKLMRLIMYPEHTVDGYPEFTCPAAWKDEDIIRMVKLYFLFHINRPKIKLIPFVESGRCPRCGKKHCMCWKENYL